MKIILRKRETLLYWWQNKSVLNYQRNEEENLSMFIMQFENNEMKDLGEQIIRQLAPRWKDTKLLYFMSTVLETVFPALIIFRDIPIDTHT